MGQAGLNLALDTRARASPSGSRKTPTGKTNALALAAGLDVVLGAGHDSHAGTARVLSGAQELRTRDSLLIAISRARHDSVI